MMSADPVGGAVADPQSLNRYPYAFTNPSNYTDPTGLDDCSENPLCFVVLGGIFGFGSGGGLGDFSGGFPGGNGASLAGWTYSAKYGWGMLSPAESETLFIYAVANQGRTPSAFSPPTATGLSFMQMSQTQQSSWWGTFFSSFFSPTEMLKTTYHSFVDEGGCDKLMFGTLAEDLNPLPTDGPGAGDAIEHAPAAIAAVGYARASIYGVSKGLSVPLRSRVFRSLRSSTLGDSLAAEEVVPQALVVYATGDALLTAGTAAYNGVCH
jgi:hypothetical protein